MLQRRRFATAEFAIAAGLALRAHGEISADVVNTLLNHRARSALDQGDAPAAISLCTAALGESRSSIPLLLTLAKARIATREYALSRAVYDEVLAIDPRRADAHTGHGWNSRSLGDTPAALASYARALAVDPRHREALEWRGWLRMQLKLYGPAIEDLSALLAIDPDRASALSYRGEAYYGQGAIEPAIADLQRAIDLAPSWALPIQHSRAAGCAGAPTSGW
jgi:tetratricopeptide (TPR) repeat protein